MTILNLTKDPVLVLLLRNMIRGASKVSVHDNALNQRVQELRQAYQAPTHVAYEPLTSTVSRLGEILSGYNFTNHKDKGGDTMTPGNEVLALPGIIYNFKTKLDELKTRTDLDSKHFTLAELEERINQFHKLAIKE